MLAQVDPVSVILNLTLARVNESYKGIASAQRTLVGKGAFHTACGFVHTYRERSPGKQLRHTIRGSSLKNERHKVVLLIVQCVRDVLTLRRGDGKAAGDLLRHTNDAVVLSVQLRYHPDRKRL